MNIYEKIEMAQARQQVIVDIVLTSRMMVGWTALIALLCVEKEPQLMGGEAA